MLRIYSSSISKLQIGLLGALANVKSEYVPKETVPACEPCTEALQNKTRRNATNARKGKREMEKQGIGCCRPARRQHGSQATHRLNCSGGLRDMHHRGELATYIGRAVIPWAPINWLMRLPTLEDQWRPHCRANPVREGSIEGVPNTVMLFT